MENIQVNNLALNLPKRAKGQYTNNFRSLEVYTNHYEVRINTEFQNLYIYSMKINPRIPYDNTKKKQEIYQGARRQIEQFIPNHAVCGYNIISNKEPIEKQRQIQVKEHTMSIKLVKTLEVSKDPNALSFFLNNKFRNVMSNAKYSQIGRTGKFFNLKSKKNIDNLIMYSGFKANFVILQKGIFLRVDSAKKIVRDQTVLQFIDQLYEKNKQKDRDDKRNIVKNALVGQIVQVNYGTSKYYKIQDIVYKQLTQEFVSQDKKLNLLEYYKQKYNITIQKQKQPLIRAQNKTRAKNPIEILLVPSLCLMTGIPDDFDQMKRKKISQHTILDAKTKQRQITSIMQQIKKTNDFEELKKIGIQLTDKLYKVKSKCIATPKLDLGQGQSVQQGKQAFFNLFGQPIYASKHGVKLAILYWRADIREMIKTFQNTSRNLKVDFQYEKFQLRDQRRAVEQVSSTLKKAQDKSCNVCLIVIGNQLKTQYKRIKQASLMDNKMISQVFTQGKLRNKNAQSIATKVLLQILAKRGNTLWVPKVKSKLSDTMLIGIDNTSIGSNNILAACGTVNSSFTSIYSKTVKYSGTVQKFNAVNQAVLAIVAYYVERNKNPPKDIILFSNSCSKNQVKNFNQFFVNQFLKKAQDIYRQKAPCLQVVMVNVKTSERFFTENSENVKAGTLINSQVVSKDYDFYLISQNSNRGCIVPNHYKVVFSNSKMEEGVLSELIFSQCFNYVNWQGSIKIPGILQYAKKCAKFHSEVLQDKKISDSLSKNLYFV